jgi:hypothetical protein
MLHRVSKRFDCRSLIKEAPNFQRSLNYLVDDGGGADSGRSISEVLRCDRVRAHGERGLGKLGNPQFEVLGIGRTPMGSEEFRNKSGEAAAKSKDTRDFSASGWEDFEQRLNYMAGDINDPKFYPQLRVRLEEMEKKVRAQTICSMCRRPRQ